MTEKAVALLLVLVGIIHLLPISGILGSAWLSSLYGISLQEPNLLILMQHRAVLFGLLGAFLIYAAFQPQLQPLAFAAGSISVVSFIGIARAVGGYNPAIARVVVADIVAVVCLALALVLWWLKRVND